MQLSLMLNNLRQPFLESLDIVQQLEIPAVHLSATGEKSPELCDHSARIQILDQLRERGLVISALSRWGGEVDLGQPEAAEKNVEDAKRTLEMAAELMGEDVGQGIWQAHIGAMPATMKGPRWESFLSTVAAIAEHGEKVGACLAIETGPEPCAVVEQLIKEVGSSGIRVNYDPANLILWPALFHTHPSVIKRYGQPETPYDAENAVREFEPVEGVKRLAPFIVHTHAKDALVEENKGREVPLGEGWVDWPRYLRLLKENGYQGYLAIERETGTDPVGDIRRAAEFLREQLKTLEETQ